MPYKNPNSEEVKARRRERSSTPEAREKKRIYQAEYYRKSKEHHLTYAKKRRNKRIDYLNEIKSHPCMDCGASYPPYVMDLDHRNPEEKIANVSSMKRQGTWEDFLAEIEKCDIVCSNCHRIRTHERKDYLG